MSGIAAFSKSRSRVRVAVGRVGSFDTCEWLGNLAMVLLEGVMVVHRFMVAGVS